MKTTKHKHKYELSLPYTITKSKKAMDPKDYYQQRKAENKALGIKRTILHFLCACGDRTVAWDNEPKP